MHECEFFTQDQPHQPVYRWKEDCLQVPLTGHYDPSRLHNTLCEVQIYASETLRMDWTRMIIVHEDASTETDNIADAQLLAFNDWSNKKGCYATAVVIPPNRLDDFMHIHALSQDPHNGVRVFLDQATAENWLLLERQRHRRRKLH